MDGFWGKERQCLNTYPLTKCPQLFIPEACCQGYAWTFAAGTLGCFLAVYVFVLSHVLLFVWCSRVFPSCLCIPVPYVFVISSPIYPFAGWNPYFRVLVFCSVPPVCLVMEF